MAKLRRRREEPDRQAGEHIARYALSIYYSAEDSDDAKKRARKDMLASLDADGLRDLALQLMPSVEAERALLALG